MISKVVMEYNNLISMPISTFQLSFIINAIMYVYKILLPAIPARIALRLKKIGNERSVINRQNLIGQKVTNFSVIDENSVRRKFFKLG